MGSMKDLEIVSDDLVRQLKKSNLSTTESAFVLHNALSKVRGLTQAFACVQPGLQKYEKSNEAPETSSMAEFQQDAMRLVVNLGLSDLGTVLPEEYWIAIDPPEGISPEDLVKCEALYSEMLTFIYGKRSDACSIEEETFWDWMIAKLD